MCGILGYSHIAKGLPASVLAAALRALVHRGPDHQGRFCSECISLGGTRPRILDLEGGDPPLFSADRDVVVVFNGEVFNCEELRAELEGEGFGFGGYIYPTPSISYPNPTPNLAFGSRDMPLKLPADQPEEGNHE